MLTGGVTTTYTCDAANQLKTLINNTGTTSFSYDADGNQTVKVVPGGSRTTQTWDFESRLTQVALATGVPNTFVYDADGKRVQKQDSSGTSKLIWDLPGILEETDGNDITQVIYTRSLNQDAGLVSALRTQEQFFSFDGLGSTDRLTDGTATVTDSYIYRAFGSVQASTGTSTNPFRYLGQANYYFDPDITAYYLRARYYDPITARFLSRDPIRWLHGAYMQYHWFVYARNNPVNRLDPSGLACILRCCARDLGPSGAQKGDQMGPPEPDPCEELKKEKKCRGLVKRKLPDPKTNPKLYGLTYCSNGRLMKDFYKPREGDPLRGDKCFEECVKQHEEYHRKEFVTWCPWICKCYPKEIFDVDYEPVGNTAKIWECPAHVLVYLCLKKAIKDIKHRKDCSQRALDDAIREEIRLLGEKCGINIPPEPPEPKDPPVYQWP
jgi:RHS repeat-associated protein